MGKTKRRGPATILNETLNELKKGSQSISDISDSTKINWKSVETYLEMLKDTDFVTEKREGRKRVFYLKTPIVSENETYFSLPLKKNDILNFLYNKIKEIWKKKTGSLPGKTQVYKILFKVDKEYKEMNLPIGWYLYGPMCVKIFDPQKEYAYNNPPAKSEQINITIENLIEKYSGKSTRILRERIYNEEENELYIEKEDLIHMIEEKSKNIVKVNKSLMKIVRLADKRAGGYIAEFSSVVLELMKTRKLKYSDVLMTFDCLWKIIVLYNFKKDMKKFYPAEILDIHFSSDFKYARDDFLNKLSELSELIPSIKIKNKELEKTRGSAEPRKNKKSRKQLFEEFEKKSQE